MDTHVPRHHRERDTVFGPRASGRCHMTLDALDNTSLALANLVYAADFRRFGFPRRAVAGPTRLAAAAVRRGPATSVSDSVSYMKGDALTFVDARARWRYPPRGMLPLDFCCGDY